MGDKFIGSESEEDSSSLSLELIVDKSKKEETQDAMRDRNVYDFDLETMKEKPWLKPGADIADYFNYGFTEQTWRKYCEMQRQNRDWVGRHGGQEKPEQSDSHTDTHRAYDRPARRSQDDGRRRHYDGTRRYRYDERDGDDRRGRRHY